MELSRSVVSLSSFVSAVDTLATVSISVSQRLPQKNAGKSICHVARGNNSLWMVRGAATKEAIALKGQRFVRVCMRVCVRFLKSQYRDIINVRLGMFLSRVFEVELLLLDSN